MYLTKGSKVYEVKNGSAGSWRWTPTGTKVWQEVTWKPEVAEAMARDGVADYLIRSGYKRCDKPPSMRQIERWAMDSVVEATDGCNVEPDGDCEHGHLSWLRVIGII